MGTVWEKEEAVLLSKQEYECPKGSAQNLFDFMHQSPLKGVDLACERDRSPNRDVEL